MKVLTKGQKQVRRDLMYCFNLFPNENLIHLLNNIHRLRPGAYVSPDGGGCLFKLLGEAFAKDQQIDSRIRLREFFTGGHDQYHYNLACYQPAKNLVWLNDEQASSTVPHGRYGTEKRLDPELLRVVLEEAIAVRQHPRGSEQDGPDEQVGELMSQATADRRFEAEPHETDRPHAVLSDAVVDSELFDAEPFDELFESVQDELEEPCLA